MRIGMLVGACLWALIFLATGCASTELYSKVGWRRVDEQSESQRTYREDTTGLRCLFTDCNKREATDNGS